MTLISFRLREIPNMNFHGRRCLLFLISSQSAYLAALCLSAFKFLYRLPRKYTRKRVDLIAAFALFNVVRRS